MKLPRRPAAVIFDMDGLLFDTEALYQEAVAIAAVARGFDAGSGIFVRTIGLPIITSAACCWIISARHFRSMNF
jgi:beta-phosphoglucomutase-like phosphatase (HAD superfamily)